MKDLQSFNAICTYLPAKIKSPLMRLNESDVAVVNEIRIRLGKPIAIHFSGRTCFLLNDGGLTERYDSNCCIIAAKSDVDEIFSALCRYSVHSCSRELLQGFFTIAHGVRVGISGCISPTESQAMRCISGLNFRISREVTGCADSIFERIYSAGPRNILLCGGVNTGKTTILRDLCRLCGNKYKVTLIDERNEISASASGVSTNDTGIQTDIIVGSEKAPGIVSAVRTLSPQIIFCDELCTSEDSDAIMGGFGCGVKFAATVHAESFEDLHRRVFLRKLLDNSVFDYAVILEGSGFPGRVKEIRRLR